MYKPVNMKDVTYDRLTEICQKVNKSKMALLAELIDELYILVKPINQANLEFSGSQIDGILTVLVRDRNKLIIGEFDQSITTSEKETNAKIKARVEYEFDEKRLRK